jgi:hypothetical protein
MIARKPYKRQHFCNSWSCRDGVCQSRLTEGLQTEIKSAAGSTVAITDALRKHSAKGEKAMSNFLTRHVKGKFWKILSDDRCLLISTCDFPGSVRRFTKKVINSLIPSILEEPWTPEGKVRRVTRRRAQCEPVEENPDKSYAQCRAGEGRLEKMINFSMFKTDEQRACWLVEHEHEVMLFSRGIELIAAYPECKAALLRKKGCPI